MKKPLLWICIFLVLAIAVGVRLRSVFSERLEAMRKLAMPVDHNDKLQRLFSRLKATQDPLRLQEWGERILNKQPQEKDVDWSEIPGGLAQSVILSEIHTDATNKFVYVCFEARSGAFGIAIGPPNWRPSPSLFVSHEEWIPGVYVFMDRN